MIWNFLAANWFAWSFQVFVLSGTACLLTRLLRIEHPKARMMGAQAALLLCCLLPFLEHREQEKSQVATALEDNSGPIRGKRIPRRSGAMRDMAVPVILLAGATFRSILLGAGLFKMRPFRASARPAGSLTAIERAITLTGTRCRVAISAEIHSPATFGVFRPIVLLPHDFLSLSDESQLAIACHELLHVRRKDWLAALAEEVALALFWFQPAIHLLVADIRLAREKAVDRQVVALTRNREHYLNALLAVAGAPFVEAISIAPLFLRHKNLKSRITFLIEELSMSKTKLIYANLSLAVALGAAGWMSSVTFPLVAAAAQSAEKQGAQETVDPSAAFPRGEGKRIRIGGNALAKNLLSQVKPVYPAEAKAARIQGTVKLGVLIGTDGHVRDLVLISGDGALAPAASDAVRRWVYRPVLLNGEPVEAVSVVDVNFTLMK